MAYVKALLGMTKKCLVLDLDQTLWGGIIGEDGLEGIKLGPTSEGSPYWEFQKMLLALYQRGIILAVNSKNNPEDALKVMREHPYMILREEHFAALLINWEDKVSNMKQISEDLNLGLESFVFFDDDPLNREMVVKALPEVYVINVPQDPANFITALQKIDDFNSLQYTDEDIKRGRMYAARRQMEQAKKSSGNISDYLKDLQMKVKIVKANLFSMPRLAQLVQKTNQFNMTTKRYSEEEVMAFAKNEAFIVLSVAVADKFGDQGIVGVVILEKSVESWRIDTFLLSCRVIGRLVEEAILAYILKLMRADHIPKLIGEFIPTKKNIPAQDFYLKQSFTMEKTVGDVQYWVYPVERFLESPDYIKVITEDV
jgi:FkbH-like protein